MTYRTRVKLDAMEITTGIREFFCTCCGEITTPENIEFHHIDPMRKVGNPARLLRKFGKAVYFEEIVKCKPVCKSCHKDLHK